MGKRIMKRWMAVLLVLLCLACGANAERQLYAVQGDERYFSQAGKIGLMNATGSILAEAVFDIAYPFCGDYAVVARDGCYGLIDRSGKMVLDARFSNVICGNYGAIAALDGYYGVWSYSGEEIIPPVYDLIYENGPLFVVMSKELYGAYDAAGNIVVDCVMSGIGVYHEAYMCITDENYMLNYINGKGEKLLESAADYGTDFSPDYAAFWRDGALYFADVQGNIRETAFAGVDIFPQDNVFIVYLADGQTALYHAMQDEQYSLPGEWFGSLQEGMLAFGNADNKWGFCNDTGAVVVPAQYDWVWPYAEGIACVQKNGKWLYIDKSGTPINNETYDQASSFSEGLAACMDSATGKTGFINTEGKWAIEPAYDVAGDAAFADDVCGLNAGDPYENVFINRDGEIVCCFSVPIGYFR